MNFTEDNFVTIQGWMRTGLGLKGNDLLVYAAIYGFSQKDDQWFTGGQQYLAELCGSPVRTIRRNLKNLEELGLIEATFSDADARYNKYRATSIRKIEDIMSPNKIQDNMSPIEDNMSPIAEGIEDISNTIEDTMSPNRGHDVPHNINKYKYKNINTTEHKEINKSTTTTARAYEDVQTLYELTEERRKEITLIWNSQMTTRNINGIHPLSGRENRVRLCIGRFGYEKLIEAIEDADQQAWFQKLAAENSPVKFDWFCNPDNLQKVIEGNYTQGREKVERKTIMQEMEDW